jgi:hypothetical protein
MIDGDLIPNDANLSPYLGSKRQVIILTSAWHGQLSIVPLIFRLQPSGRSSVMDVGLASLRKIPIRDRRESLITR